MRTSVPELALATQIGWAQVPLPTTEHRFDLARRWRFDFAWPELKVAAEVEGGTFTAGRHSRGRGFEADCEKYSEAAIAGWLVVRVTSDMVKDGRALGLIERAIAARSQAPEAGMTLVGHLYNLLDSLPEDVRPGDLSLFIQDLEAEIIAADEADA